MAVETQSTVSMPETNNILAKFLRLGTAEAHTTTATEGETTVLTLHEGGGSFGYGYGGDGQEGGGGGGGVTWSRPVAAVIITPTGVRVEPVVDATKIALTFFTTLGAIFMAIRHMRQASRTFTRHD